MATLNLMHILTQHRYEAEDLLLRLKRGEDFNELARKYSQCSSKEVGGDLGSVDPARLDSDFAEIAEQLKIGEFSSIVRTRFGHHIILRY